MSEQPNLSARDAIKVAQNALQKANELEADLENNRVYIEQLENRIEQLEARTPQNRPYSELDRQTKVGMVREHLIRLAQDTNGKAAIEYDDVQWGVFDGEPSADHCYTLMECAATADGFEYENPSNGNIRLTVNTARTNTETEFSHANNN